MLPWEQRIGYTRDARHYAELARISGLPAQSVEVELRRFNYRLVSCVSIDNLFAYVAESDHDIVISFQGSNDLEDLKSDFDTCLVKKPWGNVHGGFSRAWDKMVGPLISVLAKMTPLGLTKPIVTCGFSLGASLALLCSLSLKRADFNVGECWAYGMPRTGDSSWKRYVSSSGVRVNRIVNNLDVVSRFPAWTYRHVGESAYISRKAQWVPRRPLTLNPIKWILGSIEDHRLVRYLEKLNVMVE